MVDCFRGGRRRSVASRLAVACANNDVSFFGGTKREKKNFESVRLVLKAEGVHVEGLRAGCADGGCA